MYVSFLTTRKAVPLVSSKTRYIRGIEDLHLPAIQSHCAWACTKKGRVFYKQPAA